MSAYQERYGQGSTADSAVSLIRHLLSQHENVLHEAKIYEDVRDVLRWVERYSSGSMQARKVIAREGYARLLNVQKKMRNIAQDYMRMDSESPAPVAQGTERKPEEFIEISEEVDAILGSLLKEIDPELIQENVS